MMLVFISYLDHYCSVNEFVKSSLRNVDTEGLRVVDWQADIFLKKKKSVDNDKNGWQSSQTQGGET